MIKRIALFGLTSLVIFSCARKQGEPQSTPPASRHSVRSQIPPKAREYFQKALNLNRGNLTCSTEILRQKALLYRKAIEEYPNYAAAWNNLGDVYENLAQLNKALNCYQTARNIAPNLDYPYFGMGDIYFKQGRYQKAIDAYIEGLKRHSCPAGEGKTCKECHLSQQRLQAAKSALEAQKRGIIPKEVIIATLAPKDQQGKTMSIRGMRGVDGVTHLPSMSFNERILPFEFNSAELNPQAKRQLDELAAALNSGELRDEYFEIAGHCDERGSHAYNDKLSLRRAQRVKDYLVAKNVKANHLRVVGYGKRHPVIKNAKTEAEHALNRRVEIRRIAPEDLKARMKGDPPPNAQISLLLGVLRVKPNGRYELISSAKTAILHSGDLYQIYIHPHQRCYLYIYQVDGSGKGEWLFPSKFVKLSNPLNKKSDYWLPLRDRFFRLDNTTGQETIHIVASLRPLQDLPEALGSSSGSAQPQPKPTVKKSTRPPQPAPMVKKPIRPQSIHVIEQMQMRGVADVRPATKTHLPKMPPCEELFRKGAIEFYHKITFQHR